MLEIYGGLLEKLKRAIKASRKGLVTQDEVETLKIEVETMWKLIVKKAL